MPTRRRRGADAVQTDISRDFRGGTGFSTGFSVCVHVCVRARACACACNDRVRVHGFVSVCASMCVVNGRVFVRARLCVCMCPCACVRPCTLAFMSACARVLASPPDCTFARVCPTCVCVANACASRRFAASHRTTAACGIYSSARAALCSRARVVAVRCDRPGVVCVGCRGELDVPHGEGGLGWL